MAIQNIKDVMAAVEPITLADTMLVIDTIQDSYTKTYKGGHPFKVVKTGDEYAVFPMQNSAAHTAIEAVPGEYPVLFTEGATVFYTSRTTIDPYNFAVPKTVENVVDKERAVLGAFLAFAHDEFQFGPEAPFQIFLTGVGDVIDGVTTVAP